MGGHEHRRKDHKSSRSGAWEGFEKLKKALEGLATAKGVSQSRISAVAKLAAHYSKVRMDVLREGKCRVLTWSLYDVRIVLQTRGARHRSVSVEGRGGASISWCDLLNSILLLPWKCALTVSISINFMVFTGLYAVDAIIRQVLFLLSIYIYYLLMLNVDAPTVSYQEWLEGRVREAIFDPDVRHNRSGQESP